MTTDIIICAAGRGERAGFNKNKLLVPLYGAPVIYHTLSAFEGMGNIILACSEEDFDEMNAIGAHFGAKTVSGGKTRSQSVYNALKYCTGDIVLIHDGARPFVSKEIIDNCIECVKRYGSGICAVQSTDTAAICGGGKVVSVPERQSVFNLQTPQGFVLTEIKAAYEKAIKSNMVFTDDSSVYARYIGQPAICKGSYKNRKLTYSDDFDGTYPPVNTAFGQSVGIGTDVHAFGKECNFITLCGVQIPSESGLIAHSDGDVAAHAVMDAVLSAAGLKDIGHYFPDNDDKYAGADSMKLLKKTLTVALGEGYEPINISLTVQAEKPRLSGYIDAMAQNLAFITGLERNKIGITAGTCEHLGFVGKGLGIAVTACVLMRKTDG